jgi:hypothetical protein
MKHSFSLILNEFPPNNNCKELEKILQKCSEANVWLNKTPEKMINADIEKYKCIKTIYKLLIKCNKNLSI